MPPEAYEDVVYAEYNGEERLTFKETIKPSGNSTIWAVLLYAFIDMDKLMKQFNELNCDTEVFSDRYFAMNVPLPVNYLQVKDELNELKQGGIVDYAEPCLSREHQY